MSLDCYFRCEPEQQCNIAYWVHRWCVCSLAILDLLLVRRSSMPVVSWSWLTITRPSLCCMEPPLQTYLSPLSEFLDMFPTVWPQWRVQNIQSHREVPPLGDAIDPCGRCRWCFRSRSLSPVIFSVGLFECYRGWHSRDSPVWCHAIGKPYSAGFLIYIWSERCHQS